MISLLNCDILINGKGGEHMDYNRLLELKQQYNENKSKIATSTLESYNKAFEVEYAHNSTAIEGNTLTLIETKVVLEDGISIGGKNLREIYEVINHNKAFQYVKKAISENKVLNENIVKDIHAILMENIFTGGIYRNVDVYISGATHTPPTPNEMYRQIKDFYENIQPRTDLNEIELATWVHAEFVRIHPFVDGNGRTSRLIMNYKLMENGWLPVSIQKENRLEYFNALESYAVDKNLAPFADMIARLQEIQLEHHISMEINHTEEIGFINPKM